MNLLCRVDELKPLADFQITRVLTETQFFNTQTHTKIKSPSARGP